MRHSEQSWALLSDSQKIENLFEQVEELQKVADRLSAAVARLQQQVIALQRGRPGSLSNG
jgi:ubiquinone biosynthesis protein UbiJ